MNKVYCCYPGGKHKALTMSYDDGRTQDRRLVALFNQYGIKGTFHLNSGFLGDERHVRPDEVAALYAGHEVACHTVTHPTIARCPLPEVTREVLSDREALEARWAPARWARSRTRWPPPGTGRAGTCWASCCSSA